MSDVCDNISLAEEVKKDGLPKTKILASQLKKKIKDSPDSVEHIQDGWVVHGVEIDGETLDYRLSCEPKPQRDGKRASFKRDCYRLSADGSARVVQFGKDKKNVLYSVFFKLEELSKARGETAWGSPEAHDARNDAANIKPRRKRAIVEAELTDLKRVSKVIDQQKVEEAEIV